MLAVNKEGELVINERFCEYSVQEQAGMLAHEVMHLVFQHPDRFFELLKRKKKAASIYTILQQM